MSVAHVAQLERHIELSDRPGNQDVLESLLSAASGGLGVRAVSEAAGHPRPAVRVNGCYGPEPPGQLLAGPDFVPRAPGSRGLRWRLDPARGIVEHDLLLPDGQTLTTTRFASAERPGTWVFCAPPGAAGHFTPLGGRRVEFGQPGSWCPTLQVAEASGAAGLLRVAAAGGVGAGESDAGAANPLATGSAALLAGHARAWRGRWDNAAITISGAPQDELGVRFALYHLLSLGTGPQAPGSASHQGWELGLGARGLSGPAYAGHVFWDAEAYVLPALSALDPQAGAAMLEYRMRRLGAAVAQAQAEGRPGARFPWESAASGVEVTPAWVTLGDGTRVEVHTGAQEIHINSDIAWAAVHHTRWTGDTAGGRYWPLVTQTASYLAERVEVDGDGSGHVRGVIGPDEYHESVSDNMFTNAMLRWHLQVAATLAADPAQARSWRALAAGLTSGYLPELGRHEQFAGYDRLADTRAAAHGRPPFEAGVVVPNLGSTQIIKQADVVMAHHLIPESLPGGSRARDVAHYLPRTSHGSSLSPAIYASVLARSGQPEVALEQLRLALRLDLDDLTGTTAGGVHIATMGGVWQAVAFGFLGLGVDDRGRVSLDPCLPAQWQELTLRCWVHGRRVAVRADHSSVDLTSDGELTFRGAAGDPDVTGDTLALRGGWGHWRSVGSGGAARR